MQSSKRRKLAPTKEEPSDGSRTADDDAPSCSPDASSMVVKTEVVVEEMSGELDGDEAVKCDLAAEEAQDAVDGAVIDQDAEPEQSAVAGVNVARQSSGAGDGTRADGSEGAGDGEGSSEEGRGAEVQ